MSAHLSGVITSLVTPFVTSVSDGRGRTTRIDTLSVEAAMHWQARSRVAAVAVAGWVGEGPTLSDDERRLLLRTAVAAKGSLKVLAHVGSPSTARSTAFARDAQADGADGLVLVVPFYNRPTHRGVLGHVAAVAAATALPIYLEIDEARTNLHLTVAQIAELTHIDNVVGIVDHTANPLHVECTSAARRGTSFFAAHEPTATACGLLGADGIFSAAANVIPAQVVALWRAIAANDVVAARECEARIRPVVQFAERHGAAGLKHLLRGEIGSERTVRLPLQELDDGEAGRPASVAALCPRSDEFRAAS